MDHPEMLKCLTGKAGRRFIEAFVLLQKPWSPERRRIPNRYSFTVYPEFELFEQWCPEPVGQKRPDAMIELSFPQKPFPIMDDVQIIVEFKGSVDDLRKMDTTKYDGYSDYYYLAVPTELMLRALTKAADNPYLGVLDVTTGRILKLSRRREDITKQRRLLTYGAMITKYMHRWDFHVWPTAGYLPNELIGLPLILPRFRIAKKNQPDSCLSQKRRLSACQRIIYDARVAALRWVDSEYLFLDDNLNVFYSMMDTFKKMAETAQFSDFEDLDSLFPSLKSNEDIDGLLQKVL